MFQECYTFDDLQIVPSFSEIESRKDCNISTHLVGDIELKIPVVSAPMDTVTEWEMIKELNRLGATGILHRFLYIEDMEDNLREIHTDPLVIAVGTKELDYKPRVYHAYHKFGVRTFLIDVAHGDSVQTMRTISFLKETYSDIKIIAGNIATSESVYHLLEWGADGLRVGIGNGSLCETRIRTGVGVPQASAIMDVRKGIDVYERKFSDKKITLIADGGIKTPGDVAKAIALGADSVMLGSLLAGTKESPGKIIRVGLFPDEQLFKLYRGSASQSAKIDRGEDDNNIEGNSKQIPYKGKVERIINSIQDGLRSAMSYVGAKTLKEFRENVRFVKVTNAGQMEAQPHLLQKE